MAKIQNYLVVSTEKEFMVYDESAPANNLVLLNTPLQFKKMVSTQNSSLMTVDGQFVLEWSIRGLASHKKLKRLFCCGVAKCCVLM
jgi:hypothetical protein